MKLLETALGQQSSSNIAGFVLSFGVTTTVELRNRDHIRQLQSTLHSVFEMNDTTVSHVTDSHVTCIESCKSLLALPCLLLACDSSHILTLQDKSAVALHLQSMVPVNH